MLENQNWNMYNIRYSNRYYYIKMDHSDWKWMYVFIYLLIFLKRTIGNIVHIFRGSSEWKKVAEHCQVQGRIRYKMTTHIA